jgi:hypothetical protein
MLRIAGVVVLALVASLAVFVQIQQRILRWRAERLLADMRELQSHKGTWADAQKIMAKWGEWGSYDGACTAERCNYQIVIEDTLITVIRRHLDSDSLLRLSMIPCILSGDKGTIVEAELRIKSGIVEESKYEIIVGNLIGRASSVYEFSPYIARASRLLHQEYWIGNSGGCTGCIKFETWYTPLAGREKIHELTDFNFSCITRLWPCSTKADIMPTAWKQYQEELPGQKARWDAFDQCTVPLEFFGREEENIVVTDLISRQARTPDSEALTTRLHVIRVLKGQIHWPLNKVENAIVLDPDFDGQNESSDHLAAGMRYILFGELGKDQTGRFEVSLDKCGAVPYNEQNLSAIQRGIDASLARRIPEK